MRHNWALAIAMLVIGLSVTTSFTTQDAYAHAVGVCSAFPSGGHTKVPPVLTATVQGTDSVLLEWTQASLCQHFLGLFNPIFFIEEQTNNLPVNPSNPEYMIDFAGGTGTTSFLVENLTPNTQYCFEIKAVWATIFFGGLFLDSNAVCVTIPASGGGDENEWRTKPTFGISPTSHNLVIKCGFGMDNNCYDMTSEWHTPFDKIVINTGETHDFELNIQAQMRLKQAGFCLVPSVGSMEGEFCTRVNLDGNGNIVSTEINQDEQLVDESLITFGVGREGANYKILINDVKFLDQPFYEVIGLYATDWQPRVVNTFLNEGIDVIGESLLDPVTTQIPTGEKAKYVSQFANGDSSNMITLTRIDKFKDIWTTENGVLWTKNSYDTWMKLSSDEFIRFVDETQKVMTRNNSNFQYIKLESIDQAEQKMMEMYPQLYNDLEFAEIGNVFTHDEPYINHKELLAQQLFN